MITLALKNELFNLTVFKYWLLGAGQQMHCRAAELVSANPDGDEVVSLNNRHLTTSDVHPSDTIPSILLFSSFSSIMTFIMATTTTNKEAFAVIETGGKQYIVSTGDTLEIELLRDHKEGDTITFDTVLMTDDGAKTNVGTPYTGSKVTATYLAETKGPKLSIIRFKAKSNRDRKLGHRQHYAEIKIDAIA